MFLVSACSCLCAIYWSQVFSGEWRCSWSSADRRCSNYIWFDGDLGNDWRKFDAMYISHVNMIDKMQSTHYSIVMPYGDRDTTIPRWRTQWRHQAITWTNVDLDSSIFTQYDFIENTHTHNCKKNATKYIFLLTIIIHLSWDNEFTIPVLVTYIYDIERRYHCF